MFRAIPVGNKVCARRVNKRYEDTRQQRLRDMQPQIDTTCPKSTTLRHLKINWKRDEAVGQRYDQIHQDNVRMLSQMQDMMKKAEYGRSNSLPCLRGPGEPTPYRKREVSRITKENLELLDRLQNMESEIKPQKLEDCYKRSNAYVRLACEYQPPPLLNRKRAKPKRSSTEPSTVSGAVAAEQCETELKYVFREEAMLGSIRHLIEMATDGYVLMISAYNMDFQHTLEMIVNEANHRKLHEEIRGDYRYLVDRLRVDEGQLVIDPMEQLTQPVAPLE